MKTPKHQRAHISLTKPRLSFENLPTVFKSPSLAGIESSPLSRHFIPKHGSNATWLEKDLPPTPVEPQAPTLELPIYGTKDCTERASSVYSQPVTTWERPAWWELPEAEETEQASKRGDFTLPPTVYHDEAARMLEATGTPVRAFSPVIPAPSPTLSGKSQGSGRQSVVSAGSERNSPVERNEHGWTPLPPTPQSLSRTSPALWDGSQLALSSPESAGSLYTSEPSPGEPPAGQSWYEEEEHVWDDDSRHLAPVVASIMSPSLGSLPRGRTRHRSLPSYFHREQNYLRNSDKRLSQISIPAADFQGSNEVQRDMTNEVTSQTAARGSAKSEADDLLKQKRVKTLSEAYHKLLIEDYQDLAADGRAWEVFTDTKDFATIGDAPVGQDLKLIPEPLFHPDRAPSRPGATPPLPSSSPPQPAAPIAHARNVSTSTAGSKPKVGLASLISMLPAKMRRNDSLTSGEIPIVALAEADGRAPLSSLNSPKQRNNPWGKEAGVVHKPPLPLVLPNAVARARTSSLDRQRASPPHKSRDDGSHPMGYSQAHKHMRKRSGPQDGVEAARHGPLAHGSKAYDILVGNVSPASRQAPSAPASSIKGSLSFLDRLTKKRTLANLKGTESRDSTGAAARDRGVLKWHGKARGGARHVDPDQRRRDLKSSIKFVGQVDPRNVETIEDTNRRLAYATGPERKPTFGEGWDLSEVNS